MKLSLNLFLLLCCFSNIIFSQTVTVSEGLPIRNDHGYAIIGKLDDQFLLYREKVNNEHQVQAFDNNLMLSWKKEIELDEKRAKVLEVINGEKNFHLIYSYRKGNDIGIMVHTYDATATLRDSSTILFYEDRYVTPKFKIMQSENREVMLLYFIESQKEIFAMACDLEKKKLLWEQSVRPEGMNYFKDFSQILIDDRANMFVVLDKNNKKLKKEEHHFHVYQVHGGSGEKVNYTIPLNSMLTFDVHFSCDNLNNRLTAAGLSSAQHNSKADGYFFLSVDPLAPENFQLNFKAFDEKFIANFMGKAGKSINNITDTKIKEIVHRKDGGILMFAERDRKYERRLGGASSNYTADNRNFIVDYYFEEVFVISIHPDGEKHWSNILHKKQYSQDDRGMFSSFFLLKTPKNLRVLFNDEIKYENTVSEYVIFGNGKCDRNSVLSTDDQKIKLRFQDALQISANEILVPSQRKQELKLIRITFG